MKVWELAPGVVCSFEKVEEIQVIWTSTGNTEKQSTLEIRSILFGRIKPQAVQKCLTWFVSFSLLIVVAHGRIRHRRSYRPTVIHSSRLSLIPEVTDHIIFFALVLISFYRLYQSWVLMTWAKYGSFRYLNFFADSSPSPFVASVKPACKVIR